MINWQLKRLGDSDVRAAGGRFNEVEQIADFKTTS